MAVERDQLATSSITNDTSTSRRNLDYIQRKINAFKDGVVDGLIKGIRSTHNDHHYYNQGYDFGVHLYGDLKIKENSE